MFREALTWLTTPAPDWARKLGYLHELIAIEARHRRWRAQWQPHLDSSQAAIRQAVATCNSRREAVVYGSGLLLDVPLAELAETFERVFLVDAAHLRVTRRKARRFANVECVEADLSGVAIGLMLGVGRGADRLPVPRMPDIEDSSRVDLAISANLLTQLPVTPLRYLARRLEVPAEMLEDYARTIMQAHLDHLMGLNAVRCLITETAAEHLDRNGSVIARHDTLRGIAIPPADRQWRWTVAPRGELSPDYAVRNAVAALTLMPQCSEARRNGAAPRLDSPYSRA